MLFSSYSQVKSNNYIINGCRQRQSTYIHTFLSDFSLTFFYFLKPFTSFATIKYLCINFLFGEYHFYATGLITYRQDNFL
jgi:hypothetical protein